jgi:hypothetical protein
MKLHLPTPRSNGRISQRIEGVRAMRVARRDISANAMAERARQMREMNIAQKLHRPRAASARQARNTQGQTLGL